MISSSSPNENAACKLHPSNISHGTQTFPKIQAPKRSLEPPQKKNNMTSKVGYTKRGALVGGFNPSQKY